MFRARGLKTEILDYDHNWDNPEMPWTVLSDPVARKYVSGVAWHCYEGDVPAQSQVHDAFPDKDAWFTECSGGEWAPKFGETLGWFTDKLIIGASNTGRAERCSGTSRSIPTLVRTRADAPTAGEW